MNAQQLRNSILQEAIEGRLVPPACRQAGKTLTMNPQTYIKGQSCWFTYVIECEDGSFYKGFTDNLLRRYKQHCDGIGAEHTKRHKPKQLYYWEMHYSQEEALAREKYLKSGSGREWFQREVVEKADNWEPASVLLAKIRKEKEQLVKEGKLKKKDLEETPISEDEKPFEIPESWKWVRISDVVNVLMGQSPDGNDVFEAKEGDKAYEFHQGKICFTEKYITPSGKWCKIPSRIANKDSLLICVRAPIGDVNITQRSIGIGRGLAAMEGMGNISNIFLFYWMLAHKRCLEDQGTGSTFKAITVEVLKNQKIPLPPLAEQKRIVAKIEELLPKVEAYGKAQESLDKLNEELPERLKKSILQEAIEGRLVPQDPNDEPASVLLDKIRKEKEQLVKEGKLKMKDLIETPITEEEIPFEIPESWEWVRLGDLVTTSTGKTPARGDIRYWGSNDYPWVSISDMKQGELVKHTKEYVSCYAAKECFNEISKIGTLIMSFKLTVGRTSILGLDAYHNEAIISIKTYADKNNYTRDYLSYILPIVTTWGDSKDAIKGKTLNAKSIYNLYIPLPPLAEQHRIVAKMEELFAEIDKLKM
jgi:type I restriction enzyme S subunit